LPPLKFGGLRCSSRQEIAPTPRCCCCSSSAATARRNAPRSFGGSGRAASDDRGHLLVFERNHGARLAFRFGFDAASDPRRTVRIRTGAP